MKYQFEDSELTKEKSLWDIYKQSRRITPSRFQVLVFLSFVILLGFNAAVFSDNTSDLLKDIREWAKLGFNFSVTTLGLLIAGFTIFSTLSKPEMLLAMMDHIDSETGLPTLKRNFFSFMKVLIAYLITAAFYLSIILFGQPNGLVANLVYVLPYPDKIKCYLVMTTYIIVGGSIVYLLLMLKSFVYNIYIVVMNHLRWEYHN